ncbi:MAG: MBL fold metallo-hydrolase [Deltaproteobacteria bacterium]|uniref:MBL fold metallo-hydrolase n=1 Tax=Candidatus Zymogenus saltonus TaxID=2844893 RepID=A0A9D8PNT2_9DELT|nr:MBL fold metallo-hydrolase [Candidatus Zymogenus saltonus]
MWIKEPGPITDRITLLGKEESCVYLVGKDEYSILGGGMTYVVPDIVKQLDRLKIDRSKIGRLLILHSHFDHVGAAPGLKKLIPGLTIISSPRGMELLKNPKVADSIRELNMGLLSANGLADKAGEFGLDYESFPVDDTVSGGDVVNWGGVELQIIDAPGHSSCSIGVYMPEDKALFASDAGGIPFGDTIFASGNSNFTKYQESLERFATYDVEIHLAEHYGAFTGEEGRSFMKRSIESAKRTRKYLEESYARTGDIRESTAELTDLIMEEAEGYFLPKPVMEMVVEQMVRHIAKVMDG